MRRRLLIFSVGLALSITLKPILTTAQQNAEQQRGENQNLPPANGQNEQRQGNENRGDGGSIQPATNAPITTEHQITVISQPTTEPKQERSTQEPKTILSKFVNATVDQWPNVGILIVAAFTLRYAKRAYTANRDAANEAKRQADAAQDMLRLSHRPKLIVRKITIPAMDKLNNNRTPMGEITSEMNGWYEIANIGGTVAEIVHVKEGIHTDTHLPMERPDSSNAGRNIIKQLTAGEACRIEFPMVNLSETDTVDIMDKKADAFFIVSIEYLDGAHIKRTTSACRKWDQQVRRFVTVNNPDYEYAD
jgi:hypothetical protein